jgi:peptidoglycan/LPS O-acetylase OafA/YrhL
LNSENTGTDHQGPGCLRGFVIEKLNGAAKDGKAVTVISSHIVCISILLYVIWCILFSLIILYYSKTIVNDDDPVGIFPTLLATVFLFIGFVLVQQMQPQKMNKTYFMLPTPPLWPCLSIVLNIILLVFFGEETWIMFGIWMLIGLAIYLWYGRSHSKQLKRELSLQKVYELRVLSISGASDLQPNTTVSSEGEEPVKKTWFSMFQ